DQVGEGLRNCGPWLRALAGGCKSPDRIDASAHVDRSRWKLLALHKRCEVLDGGTRGRAQIEIDGNSGIELHVLQYALERRRRCIKAVAIGAHRADHNQR